MTMTSPPRSSNATLLPVSTPSACRIDLGNVICSLEVSVASSWMLNTVGHLSFQSRCPEGEEASLLCQPKGLRSFVGATCLSSQPRGQVLKSHVSVSLRSYEHPLQLRGGDVGLLELRVDRHQQNVIVSAKTGDGPKRAPQAVWAAEEDDCKSSIPGCRHVAAIGVPRAHQPATRDTARRAAYGRSRSFLGGWPSGQVALGGVSGSGACPRRSL